MIQDNVTSTTNICVQESIIHSKLLSQLFHLQLIKSKNTAEEDTEGIENNSIDRKSSQKTNNLENNHN